MSPLSQAHGLGSVCPVAVAFDLHGMGFHVRDELLRGQFGSAGALGVAAGLDASELMDARLAVREEQERSAVDRVKSAYGEKYNPLMMHDSKRDVANLLHEEAEVRSIRERLHRSKKTQQTQQQRKTRRHEQER